MAFKMKGFNKPTDPPMTPKQKRKHRKDIFKYNKKTAKPLNATQKKKIKERLSKMDKNDPEAKLLRRTLNLRKNK